MLIAFFDTETTGFIPKKDRVVQIGVIIGELHDGVFYETRRINQYFTHEHEINPKCVEVHGLTKEFLAKFSHINEHMEEIIYWFNKVDLIVAHNFAFDNRMMQGEFELYKESQQVHNNKLSWTEKEWKCTMKETTPLCRLPKERGLGYKDPKLAELYEFLFDEGFENAHDAMADIEATKRCFLELLKRGDIVLSPKEEEQGSESLEDLF